MGQEFCLGNALRGIVVLSQATIFQMANFHAGSSLRDIMGRELTYFLPQRSLESLVLLLSK